MLKIIILFLLFSLSFFTLAEKRAAPWVGESLDNLACSGSSPVSYDYTNPQDRERILSVVEAYHFTSNVENHIKGESGSIPADIDYTLKTFANHPKALLSAIRYQFKLDNNIITKKIPLKRPVECYMQRAMHFNPKDASTFSLYAYFLKKVGQPKESDKYYQRALALSPKNAKIAYSYSLLLIQLKKYDKAVKYAQKAYSYGRPPKTLKNKLIKLGKWKDKF